MASAGVMPSDATDEELEFPLTEGELEARVGRGLDDLPANPEQGAAQNLPHVGEVLCGRYLVESRIGHGAFAAVYRGHDISLELEVALKVLFADQVPAARAATRHARFRGEALAAMRLSHPKIARVYNYERHEDWEILVMEYIEGENLRSYQKKRPTQRLSLEEALRFGTEALEALVHAHDSGVIHNDIKPSNLMLTPARTIKICDFGLARIGKPLSAEDGKDSAGTPAYMSPERISGEEGDARSDLYSLGATLYALLTGEPPFGCEMTKACIGHLRTPLPPSAYLPTPVYEFLSLAMAKKPSARFATALDMLAAIPVVTSRLRRRFVA